MFINKLLNIFELVYRNDLLKIPFLATSILPDDLVLLIIILS